MRFALLFFIAFWGVACTRPAGAPAPFKITARTATELMIAKADPASGDLWTARVARGSSSESSWTIGSAPGGATLLDRRGDDRFIHHLLDSLETLQVLGPAPNGSAAEFGLDPPRMALQWKAEGKAFELRLGQAVPRGGGWYALIPARSDHPVIVKGAAPRILAQLERFETLRLGRLSAIAPDDVDEFELKRAGMTVYYAERESGGWVDRARKPLPDADAVLEKLTQGTIRSFVDDENEAARLRALLAKTPLRALFRDRENRETEVRLAPVPGGTALSTTSRPGGVFLAESALLRLFEPRGDNAALYGAAVARFEPRGDNAALYGAAVARFETSRR